MQADIKCPSCGKVLGTIEKDEITQQDMELYNQMCKCDCGAQAALDITEES
jgi:hypothetical protein